MQYWILLKRQSSIFPMLTLKNLPKSVSSEEVAKIYDIIGEWQQQDSKTGVELLKTQDGRTLKIANLVEDETTHRERTG